MEASGKYQRVENLGTNDANGNNAVIGRIAEVSRSILSYCMSRTYSQQDAEDLSQDILVELIKASPDIKDEKIFYGFMWAVAGNLYKRWCAKKARYADECELTDDIDKPDKRLEQPDNENEDLHLLRRELAFLNERSRKAMILYYLENKSCSEISSLLNISESMVKYLLFKSRKKIKEGMNMERTLGEQSFNPKKLVIGSWGAIDGSRYFTIRNNLIQQNILVACYNDALTAEEISLQIGSSLPYVENEIKNLKNLNVLEQEGKKYITNLVIITNEFLKELKSDCFDIEKESAELISKSISEPESNIRELKFYKNDISHNALMWLLSTIVINSFIDELSIRFPEYHKIVFEQGFVWAEEYAEKPNEFVPLSGSFPNEKGDAICFFQFPKSGVKFSDYFFKNRRGSILLLDIAGGKNDSFIENDKVYISEMIKEGFIKQSDQKLSSAIPVFTEKQYNDLINLFKPLLNQFSDRVFSLYDVIIKKIKNHIPGHLIDNAIKQAPLILQSEIIPSIMELLYNDGFLKTANFDGEYPTAWIVLRKNIKGQMIIAEKNSPAIKDGVLIEDIGIETLGGKFNPLLKSGTILPSKFTMAFSTAFDYQVAVSINIYRGSNDKVTENEHIGLFEASGFPLAPKGKPQIEITVSVSEGNIYLSARDQTNKTDLNLFKIH